VNRISKVVVALSAIMSVAVIAPAPAQITLFYNGDFDGVNGLANERDTTVSAAAVYDDFVVPVGEIWTLTSVYSNNLMSTVPVSADWEIRSGVSAGNGGTLVASGNGAATTTATGRSGFGLDEFTISTPVGVVLGSGTYWLMVRPVDSGAGRSFVSTTSGANSVGAIGNNGNSFFDSTFFGTNFEPAGSVLGADADFSMGVEGFHGTAAVPEGSTLGLIGAGLVPLAFGLRRRLRK
jgi:hypothetical protein